MEFGDGNWRAWRVELSVLCDIEDALAEKDVETFFEESNVVNEYNKVRVYNKLSKGYEKSLVSADYSLSVNGFTKYSALLEDWCKRVNGQRWCQVVHIKAPSGDYYNDNERRGTPFHRFYAEVYTKEKVEVYMGNLVGMNTFMVHDAAIPLIMVNFRHSHRQVNMFIGGVQNSTIYRLDVKYNACNKVLANIIEHGVDVYFHVKTVPLLYRCVSEETNRYEGTLLDADFERETRMRLTFSRSVESTKMGHCLTYRIRINCGRAKAINLINRLRERLPNACPVYFVNMNNDEQLLTSSGSVDSVRASFKDMVDGFKEFSYVYPVYQLLNWSDEFLDNFRCLPFLERSALLAHLKTLYLETPVLFQAVMQRIFTAVECGNVIDVNKQTLLYLERNTEVRNRDRNIPGTCLVRRVFVTPSRVILRPEELHCQNRMLREFDPQFAIRVSFRDDNLEKLTFSVLIHSDKLGFLQEPVAHRLNDGLRIGLRKYEFVAASSSQLRDHGVWFYAADSKGKTALCLRDWMGDFSNCSVAAKKMARMGQNLSSTEAAVVVERNEELHEPDIEGGMHPKSGKKFVFSDGIGRISLSLMTKVYERMKWVDRQPSAIQIRFKGFKGMVCTDPSLEGNKLCLRPSMNKFNCNNSNQLEVIKCSGPITVKLNRQLITIIEQSGVKTEVLLDLQRNMIMKLSDALTTQSVAVEVFRTSVNSPLPFRVLDKIGYNIVEDPFFATMLFDIYKCAIDGLCKKARIEIDSSEGRNMMGVLDETNSLDADRDEIFVQITELPCTDFSQAKTRIITGDVLVTKCPCLHPGDVRRLKAVDVPELHHIKDCVVFASKGKMPQPFQMAGSDLDGDEYIVIWKQELLIKFNHAPHIYDDKPSVCAQTELTIADEIDFFCDYIINDVVGIVSNAHLAFADLKGINHFICLGLVQKASNALDFAKTGQSVIINRDERPKKYPDFMEKGDHRKTYSSNRALGHLYREMRHFKFVKDSVLGRCKYNNALNLYGWEVFAPKAIASRNRYNERLEMIMTQHGVRSEGEVFSGKLNDLSVYNMFNSEKTNVEILVEKQRDALVKETKKEFFDELNLELSEIKPSPSTEDVLKAKFAKASAWYMVTYGDQEINKKYFSFPWTIVEVLIQVFRKHFDSEEGFVRTGDNVLFAIVNDALGSSAIAYSMITSLQELLRSWLYKINLANSACVRCQTEIIGLFLASEACSSFNVGENYIVLLRFISQQQWVKRFSLSCCPFVFKQPSKLGTAALQAYVELSISKDPCCIGLKCREQTHNTRQANIEVGPYRFENDGSLFWPQVMTNPTAIERLLQEWTGVDTIQIIVNRGRSKKRRRQKRAFQQPDTMEISAVGLPHTVYKLENMLFNDNFNDAVLQKNVELFSRENHYRNQAWSFDYEDFMDVYY